MKTWLRLAAAVLLVCGLTSCPETTVGDDFGLKPAALKESEWNGAWTAVDDDDVMKFTVADAAQGRLVISEPGKKDDKPITFMLRRASADPKVKLLFALAREGKKPESMLLLMREAEDGVLFSWMMDHDAVAAAVEAGQLKGTTKKEKDGVHNHLESTPANYTKLLEPQFWNWSEPSCVKRGK